MDKEVKILKTQLKTLKVQRRQWKSSKKWEKSLDVINAPSYSWPRNIKKYLKHHKLGYK